MNTSPKLTPQQVAVVSAKSDIIINAVAGSGKTTTIIEFARSRPAGSRILYLAFNKSVKLEAGKRFLENGLDNVKVETAHSLAYKHVVFHHQYEIKKQGYKTHEIASLLELPKMSQKHGEYIVANHIEKFTQYFCNSDRKKVQDLDYISTIQDDKAKAFVKKHYEAIEKGTRLFLAKMDRGEIAVTHDFYLKKFQLSNPKLPYDFILFDEGQDASGSMLDIFLQQSATKLIVGDTHQQIYGWRYAINSLEKVSFPTYQLTTSFRFGADIAKLATSILELKKPLLAQSITSINGICSNKAIQSRAIIARTNLALILKAIAFLKENKQVQHIYFEGNINTYTYAEDGTSLYDILNLYKGEHDQIRDKMVQSMKTLDELEDYIEKTEDAQLGMFLEMVREYGSSVYGMLQSLKEKHTIDDDKHKAEVIFTTVHKCKGMEYDQVELLNDFITIQKIEKLKEKIEKGETNHIDKLNEEINLLYVAVTRAKQKLILSENHIPKGILSSSNIEIINSNNELRKGKSPMFIPEKIKDRFTAATFDKKEQKPKSKFIARAPIKRRAAITVWSKEQEKELKQFKKEGMSNTMIAKQMGFKIKDIEDKLKEMRLH